MPKGGNGKHGAANAADKFEEIEVKPSRVMTRSNSGKVTKMLVQPRRFLSPGNTKGSNKSKGEQLTTALVVQIPMHVRGARPAMPYTHLYSVHHYWWKRQVSHQR